MCEQIVLYLVKHSELGSKNLNTILPENDLKSTKIAVAACKFSQIFLGSMPPDPPRAFLCLNQLQIISAEQNTLDKKCGNYAPPPFYNFLLCHCRPWL